MKEIFRSKRVNENAPAGMRKEGSREARLNRKDEVRTESIYSIVALLCNTQSGGFKRAKGKKKEQEKRKTRSNIQ